MSMIYYPPMRLCRPHFLVCLMSGLMLLLSQPAYALVAQTAQGAMSASPSLPAKTATNSELDASLLYELMLAELLFNEGDSQQAITYMLDAAQRVGDEALFERATEMAIQSRSGNAALVATQMWHENFPDSLHASRYELQVLMALGKTEETGPAVQNLLRNLSDEDKIIFITALPALYQHVPDQSQAARMVENALQEALKKPELSAAVWATIGRMRLQNNDLTGALSAAGLGQTSQPDSQWPAALALQLFALTQDSGSGSRSETLVKRYLQHPDPDADVQIGYAQVLLQKNRARDALEQLLQVNRNHPDLADAWFLSGLLYADSGQDQRAQDRLTHFLELSSSDSSDNTADNRNQAHLVLARIARYQGKTEAAQAHLNQISNSGKLLGVQTERAQLLADQGKLAEARQLIQAVPAENAEQMQDKLLAEAQMLRSHGQAALSFQLLEDALQQEPENTDLLYDTAMAAEEMGRTDEMERLLHLLIQLDPEAAHAYNALGYTLADQGQRLPEAQQLIEKALSLRPDDPYIQDSLGWLYYRKGNLPKALQLLQDAYEQRQDTEIAAHLGEVLWASGQEKEAKAIWLQGLRQEPENPTLIETLKRFEIQFPGP